MIEAATDNRNRTVADIRHILSKNGGAMGEAGCVGWMFDKKGVIAFDKAAFTEDQLLEIGLDAGAEDVADEDDTWEVRTSPEDFEAVREAFDKAGMAYASAEVSLVPQNYITVDAEAAQKLMKLVDALEEHDDVQNVHSNFDIPEDVLASMG
jgi:YebC/PmpR family DNA-binding regulatory protein